MRKFHYPWTGGPGAWLGLAIAFTLLFVGCNAHQPPVYRGKQGFRFTPPPGWVERARDDALPGKAAHGQQKVPLPALGAPGSSVQERLLVRYDRPTAGYLCWLRVTAADVPAATSIKDCAFARSPAPDWKCDGEEENLEVSGTPAVRVVFAGQWKGQEYVCETVAVRHGEQVYFITASFPAADSVAREQVRKAVAGATWE